MQVAKRKAPKVRGMPNGVVLDEAARCWARLLNDPCNAPLCHPVYAGGNGGILVRAQAYTAYTVPAGDTATYIAWAPGALLTSKGAVAADTTVLTLNPLAADFVPASGYLTNNAGSVRAVAACLKVTWLGTELNRQGYCRFGNINFSDLGIPGTTSVTIAGLSQLCEASCRMPEDGLEIKWRPNDFDQQTTQPGFGDAQTDNGRRGAILLAVTGTPAASQYIVETTCVYEYQPTLAVGITAATASGTRSVNTMDHVIEALDKTGTWMYKIGHTIGQVANVAYGLYNAYTNPVGAVAGAMQQITYRARAQIMG
jgi:hypothetical protein